MDQSNEAKAITDILEWSQECCLWQRDALRRIYDGSLDNDDINALLAICKGEPTAVTPLSLDHVRDPNATKKAVRLSSVHNVENVNALALGQRLTFDRSGLTVVYGDNGAGKSGYIRILKRVCRARSPKDEKIEPNVYALSSGPQRACIKFCVEDQQQEAQWQNGAAAHPILSSVSVFDSRTANVHVDETNNVAYTPLPMRLLEELAQVCKILKDRLTREVTAIQQQTPASLIAPKCTPTTQVGKLISQLSDKTKVADVESLAMVSNQERTHCDSLMRDLASNPAAAARTLEVVRQRIRTAANAFQRLGDALDPGYLADLELKHTQVKAAQEAATLAADALFTGEPLAHVGSETWRLLWESARLYSNQEAYPNLAYPVTDPGSRCVMCQQELSVESAHRLSRFELFVKDKSKKLEAEALRSYQNGSKDLRSADMTIADINSFIALVRDELGDAELATTVRDFVIRAKWSMRSALRAHTQGKPLVAPALPAFPLQEIEKHDDALKSRIDILAGDANSPARKALKAECEELTDRLWLQVVKDDVIAEIGRRKSIAAIKASQKDTNPIRITTKSTEIAEQLVTNTLRSEFVREVERMGVSNLAIELRKGKSTYGTPQFRVSLVNKPDAKVGDVLSEGEHRCIALAAFLAELATIESRSAIVFDDPVSSLDHLHREAIAERLAAEAKHRQVIVFTHDVAFLFLLNEACANHEAHIGYRTIARGADYAGYCYPDGPSNAQPVERVIEAIQAQLTNQSIQYDRGDQAAWLRTVKLIEQQLRESWERAAEEAVSPVLRRLGSKVNTPGLARLTVITLDDCNSMRAAFGRCSRLLHSTPGSLNPRLPNPTRIQAEIDALRNWYIDVKRRQDAVAESHD